MSLIATDENIFFTADWHIGGHKNIITYCNRPFKDMDEMTAKLIFNYNSVVEKHDIVYFLGDMVSRREDISIFNKLNGIKLFILGNHDCRSLKGATSSELLYYNKKKFFLSHKPPKIRNNRVDISVIGHVHEAYVYNERINALNIGVDAWGFFPVHIKTVCEYVEKRNEGRRSNKSSKYSKDDIYY